MQQAMHLQVDPSTRRVRQWLTDSPGTLFRLALISLHHQPNAAALIDRIIQDTIFPQLETVRLRVRDVVVVVVIGWWGSGALAVRFALSRTASAKVPFQCAREWGESCH